MKTLILTGKANTGKSSFLYSWFKQLSREAQKQLCGFISLPEKGETTKGYSCYLIPEGQSISLNATSESDLVRIGPYRLSRQAFQVINNHVCSRIRSGKTIIIDEIGLLEFRKKGFHPCTSEALDSQCSLIVTVRLFLLERFLEFVRKEHPDRAVTVIHNDEYSISELNTLL